MGWSFRCDPTKLKDFLKERAEGWENKQQDGTIRRVTCLASKYVMYNPGAGVFWKVYQITGHDDKDNGWLIERFIAMDHIKWGGGRQGCYWGYKDVTVSMGLNEMTCPMKYLDMVPEPEPCGKKKCDDGYGCKCDGCHGCSSCYEMNWRRGMVVAQEDGVKRRNLVANLEEGEQVVMRRGFKNAGNPMTITGFAGKKSKKVLAGGYQIPQKAIDIEATIAANTGVEMAEG